MIEIIDDVYVNNSTKMKCRCLVEGCGYEFLIRWDHLSRGVGCAKCSGVAKLNMEEVKKRVSKTHPNVTILSNEYINSDSDLKCRCSICEHEWSSSAHKLSTGYGCPKCAGNINLTLKEVKERVAVANNKIRILDSEYINNKSKLKCECLVDKCKHKWSSTASGLMAGGGCPKCAGTAKLSLSEVKSRLRLIDDTIEIKSEKYINNKSKLDCKCLVCNHEFKSTSDGLLRGSGCKKCCDRNRSGVYNKKIADKNKEKWLKTKSTLYIIKCIGDDEEFYKIGITRVNTKNRFSGLNRMPYDYSIINEFETNLYDAIHLELELHLLNNKNNYSPKIKFGGHTECFSKIDINQIEEFLAKKKVGE